MVDFHTHILPMVDDGARNIEEAFELIEEARQVGFTDILLTTHYIEHTYNSKKEERKEYIDKLNENFQKKEANIKLYLGNEIYLVDDMVQLLQNNITSTLNDTRYVLFELPFNSRPFNMYNVIYELLENKYVPVLAHPERYSFIQQNPNIVYELIQNGVLMQSNYGSVIGNYGKRAEVIVKILLKNDMVHFLGTDVHRPKTIYPKIPQILKEIEKIIGVDKLNVISNINPNLVLKNEEIEIQEVQEIKLSMKEKILLK